MRRPHSPVAALATGAGLGKRAKAERTMTKNLADELQRTARQALAGLQPAAQGEEPGGLPLRKLLAAVFRSRYLLFGTTLAGLLIGAFLAITTANSYVSTGKFRFTASGAESTSVDPTRATTTSQETIGTAATYILSTPGLLRRVVDRVKPARILAPYQPGTEGDSGMKSFFFAIQRDWNATSDQDRTAEEALKRLQKTLVIDRPRYTDVLVATCSANDAALAQEILAAYMEEAVKYHIETYDDPKAYENLSQGFEAARTAHEAAVRSMRDFRERKAGVQDFDAELRRCRLEESEADADQRKQEVELRVKRAIIADLEKDLDPKTGNVPQYKTELRAPDISTEETEYVRQITQLSIEIEQERSRGILDTSAKEKTLGTIKAALGRRQKQAAEEPPVAVKVDNPEWVRAKEALSEAQTEARMLSTSLEERGRSREASSKRLRELADLEPEFVRLRDTQIGAEEALKSARETWDAARQKRALAAGNFSSLSQFEEASLPLEKEGPNRGKLLLGGLLVGLFLGLGLIVLRSLPDTIVRTREDLEGAEGLQVIGVVPRLDNRNLKRHRLLREKGW